MREGAMLLIVEGILHAMRSSVQFRCNAPEREPLCRGSGGGVSSAPGSPRLDER